MQALLACRVELPSVLFEHTTRRIEPDLGVKPGVLVGTRSSEATLQLPLLLAYRSHHICAGTKTKATGRREATVHHEARVTRAHLGRDDVPVGVLNVE